MILLRVNKESYFHFWEKRVSLPEVTEGIKFQGPGHRSVVTFGNPLETKGECTAVHIFPLSDTAVSIGLCTCCASDPTIVVLE